MLVFSSSAVLVVLVVAVLLGGGACLHLARRTITAPVRWYFDLRMKQAQLREARARAEEAEEAARNEALKPISRGRNAQP